MDDDLEDYKLETTFEPEAGCVLHTSWMQDRAKGIRKIKVNDRWQRKDEIGVGSFGTVYLEMTKDGRQRAVKTVRKRQAKKFGMAVDHKRELAALTVFSRSKCRQHQIFVEFLGWFEDDDQIYLTMEYFPKGDLSMYQGYISEEEAKILALQLLEGLKIMHEKGFTHRDLKPNNIFVVQTSPWWVKIGDFGISKRVRPEDATELRTEAGPIGYQAPEIRGLIANVANPRSTVYTNAIDIWSLGCVLYKIISEEVPFQSSTELRAFCDKRTPFPSRVLRFSRGMSQEGTDFVESLLKPQPSERPTAARALDDKWLKIDGISEEIVVDASEIQHVLSPPTGQVPAKSVKLVKFKDCTGRKFSVPFPLCKTWQGMEDIIRQALLPAESIGPHVADGRYDLIGPDGDIILPQAWEMMIQPDMAIAMHLWPMPEPPKKVVERESTTSAREERPELHAFLSRSIATSPTPTLTPAPDPYKGISEDRLWLQENKGTPLEEVKRMFENRNPSPDRGIIRTPSPPPTPELSKRITNARPLAPSESTHTQPELLLMSLRKFRTSVFATNTKQSSRRTRGKSIAPSSPNPPPPESTMDASKVASRPPSLGERNFDKMRRQFLEKRGKV